MRNGNAVICPIPMEKEHPRSWLDHDDIESKRQWNLPCCGCLEITTRLTRISTPMGFRFLSCPCSTSISSPLDGTLPSLCWSGGLLALGAYTDPQGLDSARAQRDLKTGKGVDLYVLSDVCSDPDGYFSRVHSSL